MCLRGEGGREEIGERGDSKLKKRWSEVGSKTRKERERESIGREAKKMASE